MRGKTRDPIIALLAEMNSIAVSLGPRRITKDGASLKSSICQCFRRCSKGAHDKRAPDLSEFQGHRTVRIINRYELVD